MYPVASAIPNFKNDIGGGAGAVLLQDLGEHLGRRHLDNLDLDAGQLLPLRTGEVQGIERLQARLPHDTDLRSGVLLGRFHGPLGRGLRPGDTACREAMAQPDAG